jgi:predicted nicotinamide N-methyase
MFCFILVMWPSAVALSRWLVSNPDIVHGRSVLELGAGCGLTGLVAAGLSPSNVVLTDFNPKVLENLSHNIALNNVKGTAIGLDFYQQHGDCMGWIDTESESHLQVHVILAADMICQPADAVAAAKTIHDALLPDGLAVVVCAGAKHRFGIDIFESACHHMELSVQTFNVADLYDGQLVNKDMGMTAGYVDGMTLTMFQIEHALKR